MNKSQNLNDLSVTFDQNESNYENNDDDERYENCKIKSLQNETHPNNEIENDSTAHSSPCNENWKSIIHSTENMDDPIKEAESQRKKKFPEIYEIVSPAIKYFIEYRIKEKNLWEDGLVKSKDGKSSGKYRYWLNVKGPSTGSLHFLDFENIDKWIQKEESYTYKITSKTRITIS